MELSCQLGLDHDNNKREFSPEDVLGIEHNRNLISIDEYSRILD